MKLTAWCAAPLDSLRVDWLPICVGGHHAACLEQEERQPNSECHNCHHPITKCRRVVIEVSDVPLP